MKLIQILLLLLLGVQFSYGGAVITSLNGLYLSKNIQNDAHVSTESNQTYLSLNLNYLSSARFIIGAIYINDTIDSGSNIEKTNGYGPQLGYLFGSWGLEAGYLTQMEYSPNSSNAAKWKSGSGFQLSLSYLGLGSQGIFWGFQWVYRVVDYKKYFDGALEFEMQRKVTETFPQIKIGYAF